MNYNVSSRDNTSSTRLKRVFQVIQDKFKNWFKSNPKSRKSLKKPLKNNRKQIPNDRLNIKNESEIEDLIVAYNTCLQLLHESYNVNEMKRIQEKRVHEDHSNVSKEIFPQPSSTTIPQKPVSNEFNYSQNGDYYNTPVNTIPSTPCDNYSFNNTPSSITNLILASNISINNYYSNNLWYPIAPQCFYPYYPMSYIQSFYSSGYDNVPKESLI